MRLRGTGFHVSETNMKLQASQWGDGVGEGGSFGLDAPSADSRGGSYASFTHRQCLGDCFLPA